MRYPGPCSGLRAISPDVRTAGPGMSTAIALDAAWIFAAFLVIIVLAAVGLAMRRMLARPPRRDGGMRAAQASGTWRLGVAAYEADELRWYDTVGVLLSPEEVLERRTLSVESRREAYPAETALLGPGKVVVTCRAGEVPETVELAMGEAALTGFLAWLEAAPPGSYRWACKPGMRPAVAGPRTMGLSARRLVSRARRRARRWPCGRG